MDLWFEGTIEGEFVQGYVVLEKHCSRERQKPRPWWASRTGITGSSAFYQVLNETLSDVANGHRHRKKFSFPRT
jgi:hypothetical protein